MSHIMPYIPANIEAKWQQFWEDENIFSVDESSTVQSTAPLICSLIPAAKASM